MALFGLCALPTGLNMALLTPPGQVPDEPAHLARAAGLLRGEILVIRKKVGQEAHSGVKIDAALFAAAFGATTPVGDHPHIVTEADDQHNKAKNWTQTTVFADIPNTATYFPVFYIPASIGLEAGKLLDFTPQECFLTARIFMLSAFLVLGSLALWLTRTGEAWLFAILTLPMTLFLASSLSVDGLLIASACLSASLLTREPSATSRNGIFAATLLGLIGATKIPYALILGFILVPLKKNLRKRAMMAALIGMPVILWALLVYLYSSVPFGKPPYHPGTLWGGDHDLLLDQTSPGANLHILLSNPGLFFSLPYDYFLSHGRRAIDEGIGILGLLDLRFSGSYYSTWTGILLFSLVGQVFAIKPDSAADVSKRTWFDAAFILFIILFAAWAIAIALYLNWTNVGIPYIEGVQGRYFILLLPFLSLSLLRLPALERIPQPFLVLPALLLGIFDLAFLPQQIVQYFYLH